MIPTGKIISMVGSWTVQIRMLKPWIPQKSDPSLGSPVFGLVTKVGIVPSTFPTVKVNSLNHHQGY